MKTPTAAVFFVQFYRPHKIYEVFSNSKSSSAKVIAQLFWVFVAQIKFYVSNVSQKPQAVGDVILYLNRRIANTEIFFH